MSPIHPSTLFAIVTVVLDGAVALVALCWLIAALTSRWPRTQRWLARLTNGLVVIALLWHSTRFFVLHR